MKKHSTLASNTSSFIAGFGEQDNTPPPTMNSQEYPPSPICQLIIIDSVRSVFVLCLIGIGLK